MNIGYRFASTLAAIGLAGTVSLASGQDFPSNRVTLIVPFPAGSGTDVVARVIANDMSKRLGQPFVIENQTGGNGIPGALTVARAKPDGYTLLVTGTGQAIMPATEKNLPFDVVKDFAPIARLTSGPIILAANSGFPPNSVQEMIALAKQKPGEINYASTGASTVPHLAMELIKLRSGIELTPVSYRGGAPAMVDVAAGVVQLYFSSFAAASPFIESGKVKVLGLSSATVPDYVKAMPGFSDVKPLADQGIDDFDIQHWYGAFAPAGTPPEIVQKLSAEFAEALGNPEVKKTLIGTGIEAKPLGSAEFAKFFDDEISLWTEAAGEKK